MLENWFILVSVVLSAFVFQSEGARNCYSSDLKGCMEQLNVLMTNKDLAIAQTDEELTSTCGHLQEAKQCVNDYTSRCFDATHRDLYRTLTVGAQQLLNDFCNKDSPFRKQYLEHAGCYKTLSVEYKQCGEKYDHQQESTRKEDLPVNKKLRKSCCLFDSYKECTSAIILKTCGPKAAELGELIVTKAGGPLVQTHCSGYKHNTPGCLVGIDYFLSSSILHSSHFAIIVLLLVFVQLKYRLW